MAEKQAGAFIKSVGTTVPARNSKAEVESLLRRYGCTKLQVMEDFSAGIFAVSFSLPDTPGSLDDVPVRLEVRVDDVARAIQRTFKRPQNPEWLREQSQRVAWRHLVLWLDAALSATTLGLQKVSEAFFAHIIVAKTGERMIDRVQADGDKIGIPTLRLLKSGTDNG